MEWRALKNKKCDIKWWCYYVFRTIVKFPLIVPGVRYMKNDSLKKKY